jgi:uncharacterized protein YciI
MLSAMTRFAVTMVHGPNWDESKSGLGGLRQQAAFDEHATFMDRLVEDGFIVLGGPLGDGEQALLIVEAVDEAEVRTVMAEDPWKPMGVLDIGEIRRWTIWLADSRVTGIAS